MLLRKKAAVCFLALLIASFTLTACSDNTSSESIVSTSATDVSTEETVLSSENTESLFAEGDLRNVESEEPNATITLSDGEGVLSDSTRGSSGSEVTITSKGIYEVTGSSENVTITVNDSSKSGNIYLILSDVSMTNSDKPCIYVENSEKVIIVCKGSSTLTYTCEDNSDGIDGAVYCEDDVTFAGSGSVSIDSKLHGVVCKNDLKVVGSAISVTAGSIGLKASDSVRIGGGALAVTSGHDGIKVQNKAGDSFFYMENGTLTINSQYDGIDVGTSGSEFTGYVKLLGGTADITSGGGSDNSKDSETSQKGIKCDGDISLGDITLTVSGADDAIHSDGSVDIISGTISLSTSDDGITASDMLTVTNGKLTITKSYEALEASDITIDGGDISVTSTDDGINAGGGSDSSSNEQEPGVDSSSGNITINGGRVYVNATGDGIDSNGSIYITGGTVIVEGPTDSGNGAIDKGDSADCVASITGGTVLAIGSTGMAVNFDSGSQCSALVSLSGQKGTKITVDDDSDFVFTTTKSFDCVVYSSPELSEGNTYSITADSDSTSFDFSSGLYYSTVETHGGAPGGMR